MTESTQDSQQHSPITGTARRKPSAIDETAEAYTRQLMALSPELSLTLGVTDREPGYSDYSPAGIAERAELDRQTLASLARLEAVDAVDQVTLAAMRERLGLSVEKYDAGWLEADLNNIASPVQEIRSILDLLPRETRADWERLTEQLRLLPGAINGYVESLGTAQAQGRIAARRQIEAVIDQSTRYAAEGGFFDQLARENGSIPGLDQSARLAQTAYRDLADFLVQQLMPAASEEDAVGHERYALASRSFLGKEVNLEETYSWGVAELDRIITEQEKTAQRIRAGASIAEAKEILNTDPQRQLQGTEALQAWMQELSDNAVNTLAGKHFEIPDLMRALECRIAPTQDGGIYYTPPSNDFSRPGRMWWSVPEGEDRFTTWQETSTVYHEGVPGHHLQFATALTQEDVLNTWRRSICWVSGHGEGWALYAERLMQELGYLDDPGDALGMLDAQRMRAARVVFDIGVHLKLQIPERWGSGTWDAHQGYEFLKTNLGISPGQLDFEFTRYLGWPGQAPSYKIGQRVWEQIRATRAQYDGAAFDLKAFHTEALKLGALPLSVLEEALLKCPSEKMPRKT